MSNCDTYQPLTRNIRVGESLTKDRKSSAACSDGLDDMVRRAHDKDEGEVEQQESFAWECRSVVRRKAVLSIG